MGDMGGIGARAARAPEAVAVAAFGSSLTYGELDARQRSLAGALAAAGVDQGDRVALRCSNRPELLEVSLGALRAGIVPVPVHHLLTPAEAGYILEDSGARWLFTDSPLETPLSIERVVTFGDAYERLLHEARPAELADHPRGRPMHYTSGTTGSPKGVWVAPGSEEAAAEASARFRDLWGLRDSDVHLVCSPLTHSGPHRFAARTLEAGGVVALQGRFEGAETLAAIELFGATTTFVVPTHLERIARLDAATLRRHDLSSMRLLAHAGAPIRDATKRATIALFPPHSVWEFYGSTEGQATRISSEEWLAKPGSVGRALPGVTLRILDEAGAPADPGEVGDVWVEDPAAERFEYWGDPTKTEAAWRDGAFTVGDLGFLDDDGYLFLTGRRNDTIISGGVNVYPQEVEGTLERHPAVAEALVYGVDDEEWGQQVRAAVVPAPGALIDPGELRDWARESLAAYKLPRAIEVVDALPRTPTGKLRRVPPDRPQGPEGLSTGPG